MNASHSQISARYRRAADACALICITIALAIFASRGFIAAPLQGVVNQVPLITVNTAVGLLLVGTALWSRSRPAWRIPLAVVVALLGALTLGEHLLHVDFRIDQLFAVDAVAINGFPPGRMSPAAALCFLFLGAALSLFGPPWGSRLIGVVEMLAAGVVVTAGIAIAGHASGNPSLHSIPGFSSLRFLTAVALAFAAAGLLCAVREVAAATSENTSRSAGQLTVGFGIVTTIVLVLGVVSSGLLTGIEGGLNRLSEARLRAAATRELKINVLAYALTLRAYFAGDAVSLDSAAINAAKIATNHADYQRLTQTPMQRDLAARFAIQWRDLNLLGSQILTGRTATAAEAQHFSDLRRGLERLIDSELQPEASSQFDTERDALAAGLRNGSGIVLLLLIASVSAALITSVIVTRSVLDSEQRLAESRKLLEATKLEAEEANLAKSNFLSGMSHELRTPLHAVLGFAQLINADSPPPTPAQTANLSHILRSGWYLLELINEILDISQIESGTMALSMEPAPVGQVLLECQVMMEPQAKKRGVTMNIAHLGDSCCVQADRTRLKQVIINLLSNAIKYGGSNGTVVVDAAVIPEDGNAPERLRISVRDSGLGLRPDQLRELFKPFSRLGQEAGKEEGTGIGLALSKRLVEAMGGKIGVESTPGVGSVFWFELKLAPAPLLATPPSKAELVATVLHPLAPAAAPLHSRTVLYVEDNPANLQLVAQLILRRPDIRLLTAVDAIDGIQLARTHLPDVILMDLHLPGISGTEAFRILRANPATSLIPVIALSANAMPREIAKGLQNGFFRYLTKPVQLDELLQTIELAINFASPEILNGRPPTKS